LSSLRITVGNAPGWHCAWRLTPPAQLHVLARDAGLLTLEAPDDGWHQLELLVRSTWNNRSKRASWYVFEPAAGATNTWSVGPFSASGALREREDLRVAHSSQEALAAWQRRKA